MYTPRPQRNATRIHIMSNTITGVEMSQVDSFQQCVIQNNSPEDLGLKYEHAETNSL